MMRTQLTKAAFAAMLAVVMASSAMAQGGATSKPWKSGWTGATTQQSRGR